MPIKLLILLYSFFCTIPYVNANTPIDLNDANALMRHVDKLWRSDSSHAIMSMSVITKRYNRTMKMEAWSKGKKNSLIIIRSPRKDRGIATLKVGESIWNYLPKIRRTAKVPPSLMSGSWMGSHFTNDDLVKESYFEDDFISTVSFNGERDGQLIIEITSKPKPNAAVVWGKIVTEIAKSNYTPIKSIYFDEEEKVIRVMSFDQLKTLNDRIVPMRMTLIPTDKPNEKTVVEYHELEFDLSLSDSLFSLKSLQRRH